MEFARKELEKYGWSEGQGLGKNKDGISKPIRPKFKFDSVGFGYDISEEFNPWWHRLYNDAANNIKIKEELNEEGAKRKSKSIEVKEREKNKSKKRKKTEENEGYKCFIKTSELENNKEKKIFCDTDEDCEHDSNTKIPDISNEELFKLCDKRTVHKGARHGLKMKAKLARLEENEKRLLEMAQNYKNSTIPSSVDTMKKRHNINNNDQCELINNEHVKHKKKKKKHRE